MISPQRLVVAAIAFLVGISATAGLLLYRGGESGSREFLVLATDLPAGAPLRSQSLRVERLNLGPAARAAFSRSAEASLLGERAAHDLAAGQLLQRGDVVEAGTGHDRRLVWIPAHDLPPVSAGDRVDLLELRGSGEQLSVVPFALGVEVHSATAAGLVVAVTSRQASAFVYAAARGRMVVVSAPANSPPGDEAPVNSLEEAEAGAR
jgi:hypothetical protein